MSERAGRALSNTWWNQFLMWACLMGVERNDRGQDLFLPSPSSIVFNVQVIERGGGHFNWICGFRAVIRQEVEPAQCFQHLNGRFLGKEWMQCLGEAVAWTRRRH